MTSCDKVDIAQNESTFDIFIVRHGERVDELYNFKEDKDWKNEWIKRSFSEGKYVRLDLNMPVKLPDRADFPHSFIGDTPLTNVGVVQATETGVGFAEIGTHIKYIYCSPSLRCVETCHNILIGMGISEKLPIQIEPGLFEWTYVYSLAGHWPKFMLDDELIAAGYNIDKTYKPVISREDLEKNHQNEKAFDCYNRNYKVLEKLIAITKAQGPGNILIVVHGWSLETCTRQLIGKNPRDDEFLWSVVADISYCNAVCLKENNSKWTLHASPIPGIKNQENKKFNYEILLD